MMVLVSARPGIVVLISLLVYALTLVIVGCGGPPERPTVTPTVASDVQWPPMELASGIAPSFARDDAVEVDHSSGPDSGTSLLRIVDLNPISTDTEEVTIEVTEAADEPVVEAPIHEPEVVEIEVVEVDAIESEGTEIDVSEFGFTDPAEPVTTAPVTSATTEEVTPIDAAEVTSLPVEVIPVTRQDPDPAVEEESLLTEILAPEGIDTLILMSGPGSISVEESGSMNDIVIRADVVCRGTGLARQKQIESEVRISIDRTAPGRARVRVIDPRLEDGEECEVDVTVSIPGGSDSGLAFEIQDSSGDIAIDGFDGKLSITSLRGSIEVTNGSGSVGISSGRGPCTVTGFEGAVKVRDGSGDCVLGQVTGNVEVWGRGGNLEIRYISGDLTVFDGREGITVQSVEGNLTMYGTPLSHSTIEGVSGSVMSKTGAP
ncbi:MAG: hypothetical protein VX949_10285 [Planctomycetota bacterium]|nr:hypothetical protein [Planctomycetota bacterium]